VLSNVVFPNSKKREDLDAIDDTNTITSFNVG
jgi:hypothetical protein